MSRIRRILKYLLVLIAAVMIPLVLSGCGKSDEHPSGEHPTDSEHPSSSEHPSGEHPK